MNTWDDQGLNRTTYWRWRSGIESCLDEMVAEAIICAEEILREEGVLLDVAA
ncbi:hypothetical protein D3C75_1296270 [compost metagenome]